MIPVCLYFQVHQPYRLGRFGYFDVGQGRGYFDGDANRALLARVAEKCYRPATAMLGRLLERHPGFAAAFSLSGCVLEQLRDFQPDVLERFRELASTGRVEFLAETSHHSLAWLTSRHEFEEQVALHARLLREEIGAVPSVFRNTELLYSDGLARWAETRGYAAVLADGVEALLGERPPHHIYRAPTPRGLPLLLRDFRMSDDIAFRFSDRTWNEYPLTAAKYDRWMAGLSGDVLPLFMDFETFGEHQWKETGIFEFFEDWVGLYQGDPGRDRRLGQTGARFVTPSQAVEAFPRHETLSAPRVLSWADETRDLAAWQGNELQRDALSRLFALEARVRASGSDSILRDFRRLTTSDHFYYMATSSASDAAVHEYFSPWDSPYEAYMTFIHVVSDLGHRLGQVRRPAPPVPAAAP